MNYITVGTAGKVWYGPANTSDYQQAVEQMIAYWDQQLARILPDAPDLIVLPEACDRYWEFKGEEKLAYYETRGTQLRDHFAGVAKSHQCYLVYSALRRLADGSWRNASELLDRNGETVGIYCKNYPTIDEGANGGIQCGTDAPVFSCDFGRVGCLICFDLNFDELRRQYERQQPDLLLFSSAGHEARLEEHWAYACDCHFVSAMSDPPARILSPLGETLATTTPAFDTVTHRINLDCSLVFRTDMKALQAAKEKYGRGIHIRALPGSGSVQLSSEMEDVTADEIIAEFSLKKTHAYFQETRAYYADKRD